ncbi:MAG: hypothetical protein HOH04_11840 [Rhodospirillaceae bacterium]|jgi:hemerythrin|nr:hypothetical protein [Rhodospirillaceae bacterium]
MIVWDDSILTGIANVDRDHKDIVEKINLFLADIGADASVSVIHDSFRRMERCIYRHLELEEKMLLAVGYDQTEPHFATHKKLTDDLEGIWDDMLGNTDFHPGVAATAWLRSWLFDHVRREDLAYRDWIVAADKVDLANERMND